MKRIVLSVVLATSFISTAAFACDGEEGHLQSAAAPTKANIGQVVEWTKAKSVTPVDANTAETRTKYGVIPGAVLLTSSSDFKLSELPADKATKLVFYCANAHCSASSAAAKRAMDNGYTNVAVLPEGIMGWKKAGQPSTKPQS